MQHCSSPWLCARQVRLLRLLCIWCRSVRLAISSDSHDVGAQPRSIQGKNTLLECWVILPVVQATAVENMIRCLPICLQLMPLTSCPCAYMSPHLSAPACPAAACRPSNPVSCAGAFVGLVVCSKQPPQLQLQCMGMQFSTQPRQPLQCMGTGCRRQPP